jgi:hypothetical protein
MWTTECQKAWEAIQQRYLDAPILVAPKWDKEFHIHTNASNLTIRAMLTQNLLENVISQLHMPIDS